MDGWIDPVVDNYNESYTIRQSRDLCTVMLKHVSSATVLSPRSGTRAAYIAQLRKSLPSGLGLDD